MLKHEENEGRSISTKKDGIGHANLIAAWVGEPPVALVLMNLIQSVVARTVRFGRESGRSSSLPARGLTRRRYIGPRPLEMSCGWRRRGHGQN